MSDDFANPELDPWLEKEMAPIDLTFWDWIAETRNIYWRFLHAIVNHSSANHKLTLVETTSILHFIHYAVTRSTVRSELLRTIRDDLKTEQGWSHHKGKIHWVPDAVKDVNVIDELLTLAPYVGEGELDAVVEVLATIGEPAVRWLVKAVQVDKSGVYVHDRPMLTAARAIGRIGSSACGSIEALKALQKASKGIGLSARLGLNPMYKVASESLNEIYAKSGQT